MASHKPIAVNVQFGIQQFASGAVESIDTFAAALVLIWCGCPTKAPVGFELLGVAKGLSVEAAKQLPQSLPGWLMLRVRPVLEALCFIAEVEIGALLERSCPMVMSRLRGGHAAVAALRALPELGPLHSGGE
jgi:hypothetical protein